MEIVIRLSPRRIERIVGIAAIVILAALLAMEYVEEPVECKAGNSSDGPVPADPSISEAAAEGINEEDSGTSLNGRSAENLSLANPLPDATERGPETEPETEPTAPKCTEGLKCYDEYAVGYQEVDCGWRDIRSCLEECDGDTLRPSWIAQNCP